MERQHEQDPIVRPPFPSRNEAGDLSRDVRMRRHHALGLARRAAGVDHHGPPPVRQYGERGAGSGTHRVVGRDGSRRRRQVHHLHHGGEIGVHDDGLGLGIADHIGELRGRVRDGERNGDAAGPPDPPLGGDVVKAGRGEEGDPGLPEVAAPGEQALGDARRGVEQVAIAERALAGDDRRSVTVPPRPGDEGQLRQGRASITSRTLRANAPSENGFCRKATPSSRTP